MAQLNRRDLLKAGAVTAGVVALGGAFLQRSAGAAPPYPDFPLAADARPNPEPAYPAGFDAFTPPVDTSTPPAGAPQIAEWTRIAGADESMVITGEAFATTMSFIAYGSGTSTASAALQKINGRKSIITLPATLPAWSTYLIWAQNATGVSRPKLVNRTTAYWLGPDKAEVGKIIGVHGINLAHNNGTTSSWIYIQPAAGGAGQWVTPVSVNPYRVQFAVPSLAAGAYQVWVHNGHGGKYGWSKAPTNLTVYAGPGWNATQINVKNAPYNAVGNGIADDTNAIKAAITAAGTNTKNTVFFPAGTYRVSSELAMNSGTRWLGAGMASSIIKPAGGYPTQINASGLNTIEIKDLALDMSAMPQDPSIVNNRGINPANSTNVWLTNVKVVAPLHGMCLGNVWGNDSLNNCSYVYITGCSFTTSNSFGVRNSRQIFIDDCDLFGKDHLGSPSFQYGSSSVIGSHTVREFSVTNCTVADATAGVANGTLRRFMVHGNGPANSSGGYLNEYIAGNTATNVGPIPTSTDPNSGEILLWEGGGNTFSVSTANSTTATLSTTPPTGLNTTVYISEGKGLGQVRVVTAYSTNTITVDAPWDVIPDSTSRAHILHGPIRTIVYNNNLDGKRDVHPTLVTNASGVNFYHGGFQAAIANNTITNVQYGVGLWSQAGITGDSTPRTIFDSWNTVVNNSVSNSRDGVIILNSHQGATGTAATTHANSLGNVVRSNTITNCTKALATDNNEGNRDDESRYLQESVLEKNQATNVNVGINLGVTTSAVNTNFLIYKNTMNAGTMAAGSVGLDFDDSPCQSVVLVGNTFTNFATVYGGTAQTCSTSPPTASPSVSTSPPPPGNLAPNPSFETDPTVHYFTHTGSGTATYSHATDFVHTGSRSLKIVSTLGSTVLTRWLSKTNIIAAQPGVTYTGSAWLKTSGVTNNANVTINFWNSAQTHLGSYFSSTVAGTTDWTQRTISATAPANTAFIRIEFRLNGPGTLWADDASITT